MIWYCDPGHAWLKVKVSRLFKAGVVNEISIYSYIKGEYAFLEEDCDAPLFLKAIGHDGKGIKESCTNRQSKIRNYMPFHWVRACVATDKYGLLKD